MNLWKWIVWILVTLGYASLVGCQGAPQYAGIKAKPDNEVDLGWGRSIRLGAETKGTLKGLKTSNGTQIDELIIEQSPAATQANGWVPAMDAYGRQQVNFVPILKQYGDNFVNGTNAVFGGLNQLAQSALPLVGAYFQGRTGLKQAENQAPSMRGELINAFAGGLLNPSQLQGIAGQLPSSVSAGLMTDPLVKAKLQQLEDEIKALKQPASQPSAMAPEPQWHYPESSDDVGTPRGFEHPGARHA